MARNRSGIRQWLARATAPFSPWLSGVLGGYNILDPRRKVVQDADRRLFQAKTTANQLLNAGGTYLRNYCRELERNNPTARAAIDGAAALVVGTGISLEPDTGNEATDSIIRREFNRIIAEIGVHGESIYELQLQAFRELVCTGEGIWRIVPDGEDLKILPLDSEWIADDYGTTNDLTTVAGIKLDGYGRAIGYYLRNPERGVFSVADIEEVSARSMIHFFERRRPVQHRGEPWLTPIIETLINERQLVDAELKGAIITSAIGIAIESEVHGELESRGGEDGDEDPTQAVGLGSIARLYPGEKIHSFGHTRPSQQIAPFRQMLRGDIAAAMRLPQRFLDRDVSRANYSSMRADMIDTERLLAPVREWFGHETIGRLYKLMLPIMAARLGIALPRSEYRLVPDVQPYVDPQKDIRAALDSIAGNLSTFEHEIGKRGEDYRQVWAQLAKEKQLLDDAGLSPKYGANAILEEPPVGREENS